MIYLVWLSLSLVFAPSLSAKTLEVGRGKSYSTIAAAAKDARPGDTVLIHPGVYREGVYWRGGDLNGPPITVRGAGPTRPIIDGAGINLNGSTRTPRAVFEIQGDNFVFENLDIRNGRNGHNASGIRILKARRTVIRNCLIAWNDMGLMSTANDELLVENSEIAWNGTPQFNGFAHNFYLGGNRTVIRNCYIHDSTSGQTFKTRGRYTELWYNYIADAHDRIDGGDTTKELGFQQGEEALGPNAHALLVGNIIVKRGDGFSFIDFGPEGRQPLRNGILYMFNNTVVSEGARGKWMLRMGHAAERAVLYGNIFYGFREFARGDGAENISGSNNWFPEDADVPPGLKYTFRGKNPGFVDLANRDYRLAAGSVCINQGVEGAHALDGDGGDRVVTVAEEYLPHLRKRPRPNTDRIDIGALEHTPPGGAELAGLLKSVNGTPISFSPVLLDGPTSASIRTNATGQFTFRFLQPGAYKVTAWPMRISWPATPVNAQAPGSVTLELPAIYALRGQVRTTSGRAIEKAPIYLDGHDSGWAITNETGAFAFSGLPAGGNYTIRPVTTAVELTPRVIEIPSLQQDTSLTLSGPGRAPIKGSIRAPGDQPVDAVIILITGSTTSKTRSNRRGNFTTPNLAEGGSYRITPAHAKYRFSPPSIEINNLLPDHERLMFEAIPK